MNLVIGVLAFIGGLCVFSTIVMLILLSCNFWKEGPEDEYAALKRENESLREQLSKFQARELNRKLSDIEVIERMFEDLEREELIFLNT